MPPVSHVVARGFRIAAGVGLTAPSICARPGPSEETQMKITSYEATALNIPEDDPLANMPEEAGRTRPIVILRLRTDSGIEGIGVTLYGGKMSGSLRLAVEELAALTVGEDPLRIEKIIAKLRQ